MNQKLTSFILGINKNKGITPYHGRVLALDPGETTGFAYFEAQTKRLKFEDVEQQYHEIDWVEIDQISTWPEEACVRNLAALLRTVSPTIVVFENYRIYDWKSDDHKWSPVNTVQIIGSIWTLCRQMEIHYIQQSAQNAKGFWTDERLKEFGLYQKGIKHGRDATRHALHFLCFGNKET